MNAEVLVELGFLAWGAVLTVWGALLFAQRQARRGGLLLKALPARVAEVTDDGAAASVCVVIPVHNAAEALRTCVEHVRRQDYPRLSVCIVDDRSNDDTTPTARQLAAEDSRIRVRRVDSLPDGWLGKSHALWVGTRDADEDWLLFVDDDCVLDPAAVRTALTEARRRNVALLSLWPRLLAGSFWEHMLIPLCSGIMALWYSSWRPGHSASSRPFANGQFLLVRRDAYERIDSHRSVRTALIEDIALAEHARGEGLTSLVASGADLFGVRMYRDYRSIVQGWARIYAGTLRSGTRVVLSMLWLLAGSLWPYLAAAVLAWQASAALIRGAGIGMQEWRACAMAATHLALVVVVSYRFWGMGRCRRAYLWLYPVSVVVVVRILLQALWWLTVRRRVEWRGTAYRIDAHGQIQ